MNTWIFHPGKSFVCLFFFLAFFRFAAAQTELSFNTFPQDSLERIAEKASDSAERIKALTYLSIICKSDSNCTDSKGSLYLNKLNELDKRSKYLDIVEALRYYYGAAIDIASVRDSAINLLLEAYEQANLREDPFLLEEIVECLREIYLRYELNKEDLDLLQRYALSFESWNKVSGWMQQKVLFSIGVAYETIGLYSLATEYLDKSYQFGRNSSKPRMHVQAIIALHEMAIINQDSLKMEEALKLCSEIDESTLSTKLRLDIANIEGRLFTRLRRFPEALKAYKRVEKLGKELANPLAPHQVIFDKMNIMYLLMESERFEELEKEAFDLIAKTDTAIYLDQSLTIYEFLMIALKGQEKYKEYTEANQVYLIMRKRHNKRNLTQRLAESEVKFESKLKNLQIESLEREKSSMLKERSFLLLGLILIGGFLCLVFWLLFRLRKLHKITLREKELTEEKSEKIRQLEESRNNFFINASHELRTPLTLIQGPVQALIKNGRQSDEDRILLEMIASQSSSMKEQLDQILVLNKGEEFSEEVLNPSQIQLDNFAKGFLSEFSRFAEQKGIAYQLDIENPELSFEVDEAKLKTILKNLIANALKFTPAGGRIELSIRRKEQELIFQLRDTGRGIPPSSLPHIFERFYQVPSRSQEGGSGIGLAICKRYAEQMGGNITVESKEGEGSSFSLLLPFKASKVSLSKGEISFSKKALNPDVKLIPPKENSGQPLLLLVEDHAQMSNYLELMLKDYFRIEKSENGLEAIKYLKEGEIPNLIISDVMMPEMDGWEFAKELRSHKIWKKIPIIILTANNEQEKKLSFLRIGVDDYLTKPFIEEELLARIENLLSNYQLREDYLKQSSKSENSLSLIDNELSDYDRQWIEKLLSITEPLLPNFDLKIDHVAEKMALSNVQLYRKVKAFTGMTTMQFIQNLRFEKAKKMLESDPNVPIKVVSYSVGFKSEKHFSRNFKKRYGVSPSVYKNS